MCDNAMVEQRREYRVLQSDGVEREGLSLIGKGSGIKEDFLDAMICE